MKIIFAPDSFKGAMRAGEAAKQLASGWCKRRPGDELLCIPLSDGGEGLTEALAGALKGTPAMIDAHDALMRPIRAVAAQCGTLAVIESAEANGIEHLTREELDPLRASTYGVGEMICAMLDLGCREFIIGIGGSATVDGGAGMLQALGARFFDADNAELPPGIGGGSLCKIVRADLTKLHPALENSVLRIACDVSTVLTGNAGAAEIFGPQKGATPEQVKLLDANLTRFARLFGDDGNGAGDGAAGGIGFALRKILHGKMESGAKMVLRESGFLAALQDASLVVTGEGKSDGQTLCGKICAEAALAARRAGVPAVLCSGAVTETEELSTLFAAVFSIAAGPGTLDDAIAATGQNLFRAGSNLAGLWSAKNENNIS